MFREAEPLGQPDHMRVNYDPLIFVKGITQHNIRCLTSNAWQHV
jgi:hypothetical protein